MRANSTRYFIGLFVCMLVLLSSGGASAIVPVGGANTGVTANGLIGYWPFDGNGKDQSGFGYDLTLTNGAPLGPGLLGQSLVLNGVANQYAIGSGDDAAFNFGGNDFTIQVWVNLTQRAIQIFAEKFDGAQGPGWTFYDYGGQIHFYVDSAAIFLAGSPTVSLNAWHQVVVRRLGSQLSMTFDGAVVATETSTYAMQPTTQPLLIGQRNANDGRSYDLNGQIDEVAIWNRALSDAEVAYLYNSGSGHAVSGPPSYYVVCRGTEDLRRVSLDGTTSVIASGFGDALSVAQLPVGVPYAGDLLVADRSGAGTLFTVDPVRGIVAQMSPGFRPNDLYIDASGNMFASTDYGGVFEQQQGTSGWTQISTISEDLTALTEIAGAGGNYLFFASATGRIYRTQLFADPTQDAPSTTMVASGYAEIHGIATFGAGFIFATYATGTIYQASGVLPGQTFSASVFGQTSGTDADIFASNGQGGFIFTSQTSPGSISQVDSQGRVTPIVSASAGLSNPRGIVADGAVNVPTCTPATACPAGQNCGTAPDGCDGTLNCGACTAPQTCGGNGIANSCGYVDPCQGVVCESSQCSTSACSSSSGRALCVSTPVASGVSCNDGNACTTSDACDGKGSCAGAPIVCPSAPPSGDPLCWTGPAVCGSSTWTGSCTLPTPLPQGTACGSSSSPGLCDGAGGCTTYSMTLPLSFSFLIGRPVEKIVPAFTGGVTTSVSISPDITRSGLRFNTKTGQISGTPTSAGSGTPGVGLVYTLTATSTLGQHATAHTTITLSSGVPAIPPPPAPLTAGCEYTLNIAAFGSTNRYISAPLVLVGGVPVPLGADGYYHVPLQTPSGELIHDTNLPALLPYGAWAVQRNGAHFTAGNSGHEDDNGSSGRVTYVTAATVNCRILSIANVKGANGFERECDGIAKPGNAGNDQYTLIGNSIIAESTTTTAADLYTVTFQPQVPPKRPATAPHP